jgi:cobalt-zinc-cadmium efflux system membrane fusion protein
MSARCLRLCTLLLALFVVGCAKTAAPPPPAAEKPKVESDLSRTTLSKEACQSLQIATVAVQNRPVQEQLPLTGWIMAKQGNEVTITAPVAGYVREVAAGKGCPVAGLPVVRGQDLFVLEPVLSPLEQVQLAALKRGVESEIAKAKESKQAADLDLSRVLELHKQGLRGSQDVEKARVAQKHAQEDMAAAEDKRKLFAGAGPGDESARLHPLSIKAPRDATVLTVPVSPGQYVAAAAPLLTLADLSQLWVRVPVPEHYLLQLDRDRAVTVELQAPASAPQARLAATLTAKPLAVIPLVDPIRHTADMLYELALPTEQRPALAKDQMVTVQLPLGRLRESTVVPYSAVIFDAYAGTWIYLDKTPPGSAIHTYERRRVQLGPSVEGGVVVRPLCQPGEQVVARGAAALFSREFHYPPVAKAATKQDVDDDD